MTPAQIVCLVFAGVWCAMFGALVVDDKIYSACVSVVFVIIAIIGAFA